MWTLIHSCVHNLNWLFGSLLRDRSYICGSSRRKPSPFSPLRNGFGLKVLQLQASGFTFKPRAGVPGQIKTFTDEQSKSLVMLFFMFYHKNRLVTCMTCCFLTSKPLSCFGITLLSFSNICLMKQQIFTFLKLDCPLRSLNTNTDWVTLTCSQSFQSLS